MSDLDNLNEIINEFIKNSDLEGLKEFVSQRNLNSTDDEYRWNNLVIMRMILSSNNFDFVKFALDYFPQDYYDEEKYFLNSLENDDEVSLDIFKYLYNHFENRLSNQDKQNILFGELNGAREGDLRSVKFLVEEKNIDLNNTLPIMYFNSSTNQEELSHHYGILQGPVFSGNLKLVEYVLNQPNFKSINFQDHKGENVLFEATNNPNIFKLLLDFGADYNIKNNVGISIKEKLQKEIQERERLLEMIKDEN